MPKTSPRVARALLVMCGLASLAIWALGAVLPVLPAIPFLLLAAWCFVRSSPRLHRWLIGNRWVGPYIRDYQEGRGIPRNAKVAMILFLWISAATSALFVARPMWMRALLLAVTVSVTWYIFRLPTRGR